MKILSREFLPKEYQTVHAASICKHPDGHYVYAWFEGDREGAPYTFIRVYNLHGDGGSIKFGGTNRDAMPRWNPVLFTHKGKVFMFSKIGEFCDRWQTLFHNLSALNANPTAEELEKATQTVPAGLNGCVKTKPISTCDFILCGSSVETRLDWSSYIETYKLEEDGILIPLNRSRPISIPKKEKHDVGIIQPAMWHNGFCSLGLAFRASSNLGSLYKCQVTIPNNFYWDVPVPSKAIKTDLKNPNSSIDVCQIKERLFLASNPVTTGRLPLTITEMDVKMLNPVETLDITTEISSDSYSNEASYPFMICDNEEIHLVYTYGRSKIEHVTISTNKE